MVFVGVAGIFLGFANRKYLGWERFTVISSGGSVIYVQTVDDSSGLTLKLPEDLLIETAAGRGEWRVGALSVLGKKYGKKWVADSVALALGIGYTAHVEELGLVDRFVWWQKTRNTVFSELDLAESSYVTEIIQSDGIKVKKLNESWSKKVSGLFSSFYLASSDIEAEVINTTDGSGLASRMAGSLTASGIRVIRVGEQEKVIANRCVVSGGEDELKSKVGQYIKKYFDCDESSSGEDDKKIIVLIGEKYRLWAVGD